MAHARAMAPVDARKAVPSYEFWTQEVHTKAESYISYQNSTPSNTPSTNSTVPKSLRIHIPELWERLTLTLYLHFPHNTSFVLGGSLCRT